MNGFAIHLQQIMSLGPVLFPIGKPIRIPEELRWPIFYWGLRIVIQEFNVSQHPKQRNLIVHVATHCLKRILVHWAFFPDRVRERESSIRNPHPGRVHKVESVPRFRIVDLIEPDVAMIAIEIVELKDLTH